MTYNVENRNQNTAEDSHINNKGKYPRCFFVITLTRSFGYECTSAGTKHKSPSTDNHKKRHNKIKCGKGCFDDKIGHKETINHTVN